MNAKKYTYVLVVVLFCFITYHFIVWNIITKQVFQYENNVEVGALGRMSYLTDSLYPRKTQRLLPKKFIEFKGYEKADIITIGDSFSNGGGKGLNSYYQDYIASMYNLKVINIQVYRDFAETIVMLNNSGVLDKLKSKIIILETVESRAIERLSKEINWNASFNDKLQNYTINEILGKKSGYRPEPSFITNLNYNALLYKLLYNFYDNAKFSKVYIANLSQNFFTSENKTRLLFFQDDIQNLKLSTEDNLQLLNNNLNKIQKILNEKNIKLYFMPAVDKYNLYSKYIMNNKYQESTFFEILRKLDKEYTFIDTKKILREMLLKNEQDIYYSDDSHWSNKASEEIVKEMPLNTNY